MKFKTMEFIQNPSGIILDFQFNLSYTKAADLIAFIKIIETKFNGKMMKSHPFWMEKNKAFGFIQLKFDELEILKSANQHCQENLTTTGRVKSSYVGALDSIDPRRLKSGQMLEGIKNGNYSN